MASIEVRDLVKRFGRFEALKTVSLEVRDEEFAALLGPSGCGKTTLLRIIAGLEHADGGQVRIGGREVTALPPRKRSLAMVFQNYAVFPHMTVAENIGFGLAMQRKDRKTIEAEVRRAAELLHIESELEKYTGQLSGGQRQRVAVARALAVRPQVLLMDEPLSNLDALLRLEMRAELKTLLKESRTTTIYVTHDQVEAMSLADRIAVMQAGQIVQYAPPVEVYKEPATVFCGGFIGSPPMNFLPAEPDGQGRWRVGSALIDGPSQGPSQSQSQTRGPGRAQVQTQGRPPILAGIRPEDLVPADGPAPDRLSGEVTVVEPLGPHVLLTLRGAERPLRITVPADFKAAPGDALHLSAPKSRWRWFDAASGRALP